MTELTQAQKEAYARAHSSTVHLWALEFRHPVFPSPIRIVQSRDDITITLEADAPVDAGTPQLFVGTGLELREPEISSQVDSTLSMKIDGVSGVIQEPFHTANQSYTPIECSARPFSYDVNTQTVGELLGRIDLQVRSLVMTKLSVAVTLGYTNTANKNFPSILYTAQTNPGLL